MIIAFDSKTGNVRRFVQNLGFPSVEIHDGLELLNPFVLITYTTGFGNVPKTTLDFLQSNHIFLQGVAASGNTIWGDNFAISADKISNMYQVPILHKFEMSGMPEDVKTLTERVQNIRYEAYRT